MPSLADLIDRHRLTRREFVQQLAIGTSALAALSPLRLLADTPNASRTLKVIVVGAGVAGLSAAYELEKRGHQVVVLEANPTRVGGRVFTHRFSDGQYGELGAMRIPYNHELTRHYVNKLGLSLRPFVQHNPAGWYHIRGHRVRLGDEQALYPLFNLPPEEQNQTLYDFWLRSVLAILGELNPDELADLFRTEFTTEKMRVWDQFSLGAALRQGGLSEEAVEMLGVVWASETSHNAAVTEILREEVEEIWSHGFDEIIGGTDLLPRALARRLRSRPLMGKRVVRIEQDAVRGTVTAFCTDQSGEVSHFAGDALICTVPLGVLNTIEAAPDFSTVKRRAIRQVSYDSASKVLVHTRQRFWESEEGIYGGTFYTDLPIGTGAYPSDNAEALDPGVSAGPGVLLGSYTWGQPARRLAALPHQDRAELVIQELTRMHPRLRRKGMVLDTISWSWDNNPWSRGAYCLFSPGQHANLYRYLLEPEGRVFFAGEHASLTHSWMQGGFESGLRAVQQVLASSGSR